MENNNKINLLVFILIGILIFLLVILTLINRIKSQKKEINYKTQNFPTLSYSNFGLNPQIKKNTTPVVQKISSLQRIIPSFATEDGFGEEDLSNLYQEELKKKLPLETEDFYIYYDQNKNKFIVIFKNNSEKSKKNFSDWMKINGLEKKSQNFAIENQSFLPTIISPPIISPTSTSSSSGFEILVDLLKIIFDNNLSYNPNQTDSFYPTPTSINNVGSIDYPPQPLGYNPNAKGCYTPKRFIEVYADGILPSAPPNCYQNVKERVESYLTTISFLGFNIRVHQKVVPHFKAVDQELSSYKISGSTYRFEKGNYTFKSCGTYAFRCNVNASRCDRYDLCNANCVLSPHSFGFAIDLNCDTNANKSTVYDMPKEAVAAFRRHGFRWGGEWNDAMHFEYLGDVCPK